MSRKLLVVEERHSPMLGRNPRGEHTGGRAGRNGGRGRGSGGRDVRYECYRRRWRYREPHCRFLVMVVVMITVGGCVGK